VDAEWELVNVCTLSAEIEDANLRYCKQAIFGCNRMLKITLGSGTPRLKRDFGYGWKEEYQ
jgi:hypothetical protein